MQNYMLTICIQLARLYQFVVVCVYCFSQFFQPPDPATILEPLLIMATELKLMEYEDKYLAEYHAMDRYAIFDDSHEKNKEMLDAECLVLLNVIKTRLGLLQQFMTWTENMSETVLEDIVCDYFLETFIDSNLMNCFTTECEYESECNSECDSNPDLEFKTKEKDSDFEHVTNMCMIRDVCFHMEKLKEAVQKQTDQDETEVAEYPTANLLQQARVHICETVLDPQFIHSFVMEMTPNGNVVMRYSADKGAFEYFSDRAMPRRFLETVGRKYVVTFQCPHLFVDTAAEIEVAAKQHAEKAAKTKVREDMQVAENSKQIFAKFKTYNKPGKKTAATNPYSKNRSSPSASPYQFNSEKNNQKGNQKGNQNNNPEVVQERSNTYIYIDKLSSFSPVQKVSQKAVSKKAVMSYAEYKASAMAN